MEVRSRKGCCGLLTNKSVLAQLQEKRIWPLPFLVFGGSLWVLVLGGAPRRRRE